MQLCLPRFGPDTLLRAVGPLERSTLGSDLNPYPAIRS